MDFWRSALEAAEKAASTAKELGKKGLEVVEATAEEAGKKLNLNLHDKVGAGAPKAAPPPAAELEAFGITPDFEEFVRTLDYSAFRDFPAEHLLPASDGSIDSGAGSSTAGLPAYRLNPWQVRHATLVVQALKEVNELRFVLCPKYMTDEHFWHVYFTLARKYLPDKAFSWGPGDVLPSFGDQQQQEDAFSLAGLGSQLMQLGSKIQSAAQSAGRQRGLELTSFSGGGAGSSGGATGARHSGLDGSAAAAAATAGGTAGLAAAVDSQAAGGGGGMLEEDPDLEAYLQVAINTSQGDGEEEEGEGSGYAVGDDDLDLDSYINELSAEVEAAEAEAEAAAEGEAAAAAAGSGGEGEAEKQD